MKPTTIQDISLDSDGKIRVGSSRPMPRGNDAVLNRELDRAVKESCDPKHARPIPVKNVG